MALADIQTAFTGGEISPQLYGRVDIAKFQIGAALLRNFFIDYRGGAANRPGTEYIAAAKDPALPTRLIPFIVSESASYVIELGDGYMRFISGGVQLESSPGVPYEISVPYAGADIFKINYTQSADVLTLVHPSYPPANLTRTSDTTFSYAVITTGPTIQPPTITAMRAPHNQDYMYGYLITSVDLDGKEESLPSNIGVYISLFLDPGTNQVIGMEWTAPSQPVSHYNIYKWGPVDHNTMVANTVWGFIGSAATTTFTDTGIAPDFSKQPPEWGDPFSGGQFESITVTGGGSGYSCTGNFPSIPYVPLSITGDGTGAAGWAVFDQASGTVKGAFLTNVGKNYTTATITANGSGGTGATFTYTLSDIAPLNPGSTAYVQQRRVFAGSNLKPETLVMSQTGLYNNFNTTPTVLDTDAITASMASQEVNTIKSMVPVAYGLLVFTIGGSFLISGGTPGAAITPSTISIQPQTSPGANDLRPIVVNYDVLFGQAKGNRIRNLSFAWQRQSYTGSDITYLAPHLFDTYHTVDWAWAEEPYKLLWLVRDDGTLLTCTYVPEQEVFAWARHDTQGLVKSVCSVPEGDQNAVYVIVERHIPGANPCWVQYIERFANRQGCCIFDAWFLDSALSLPQKTIDTSLFLSGTTGSINIFSYDPCDSTHGGGVTPFASFVMEAKEAYDPATVAIKKAAFAVLTHSLDTPDGYVGKEAFSFAYDRVNNKLVYHAHLETFAGTSTNNTGRTITTGFATDVAPLGTYNDDMYGNLNTAVKDISSGTVTFFPAYSAAQNVPNGVHGSDGTWGYLTDTQTRPYTGPRLIDPRTSNHWLHVYGNDNACSIYGFEAAINYAQRMFPWSAELDATDGHMELGGMSAEYVYCFNAQFLILTPRVFEAGELGTRYITTYAKYTNPYDFSTTWDRWALAPDADKAMYLASVDRTGTRNYTLQKFDEPTSAPFGGPQVGGGFTDITPWSSTTGPNSDVGSWSLSGGDGGPGFNDLILMHRHATEDLIFITKFLPDTHIAASTDPDFFRVDVTYVALAGPTFEYNKGFIKGWMKGTTAATFTTATDVSDADWVVVNMLEIDADLCMHSYTFPGVNYSHRTFFLIVQAVVAGSWSFNAANNQILIITYNFPSTGAPTVVSLLNESSWLPKYAYTGFAHPMFKFMEDWNGETGLWNTSGAWVGDGWWFPGDDTNMLALDASFDFESWSGWSMPFLRIAAGSGESTISVGDVIQIGCGKIEVTAVDDTGNELQGTVIAELDLTLPNDPAGLPEPVPASDWFFTTPTETVSGLAHLEGKEVWALADGLVVGPKTVVSGEIDLGFAASSVVVGLKYTQQIKTLYLTTEGIQPGGTDQGKRKLITGTTIRLDCSRGVQVGGSFDALTYLKATIGAGTTELFTGDAREPIYPDWDTKGEICVQQDNPLPAQVLGVIVEVTPGDTGR